MRQSFLLVTAIVAAGILSFSACGSDEPAAPGLVWELPNLLPQKEEFSSFMPDFQFVYGEVRRATYRTNQQMTTENQSRLLYVSRDLDEIMAAGRVNGYFASYRIEIPDMSAKNLGAAVDLYHTQEAAQRAMETAPMSGSHVIPSPQIGDGSVAWASTVISRQIPGDCPCEWADDEYVCPCWLQFRVGQYLASVRVSRGRYTRFPGLDSVQVAWAESMAERMRLAQVLGADNRPF